MIGTARGTSLALALGMAVQSARAQTVSDPVATAMRTSATRLARNLVAAVDDMPAGKFQYKPTSAQMTVAEIALHLAGDNDVACSAIGGTKPAEGPKLTPSDSVSKLTARMKRSFAFCTGVLAKVTDSQMGEMVPGFDSHRVTRAAMLFELHEDWADHYSQLANYLRLNGLLPPTARRRSM